MGTVLTLTDDLAPTVFVVLFGMAELVYSAVETSDDGSALDVICYRTKDGMTHSAVLLPGGWHVRRSVAPFKK